jgi:hypothetical protein
MIKLENEIEFCGTYFEANNVHDFEIVNILTFDIYVSSN